MGKKKRLRKVTVYCSVEGRDESYLLEYLKEIYSDLNTMSFPDNPLKGGSPENIVNFAIKNLNNYDHAFAWIDEDCDLEPACREKLTKCWRLDAAGAKAMLVCPLRELQSRFNLENRKPVLIVSQPVCVESLILKVLGKRPKYKVFDKIMRTEQIRNLKSALKGVLGSKSALEYYRTHLSQAILEKRRKEIPELDLLIRMIEKKDKGE